MNTQARPKDMKKKKWKQVQKNSKPVVFCASHRHARISARKVRSVMDLIRGKDINEAQQILEFSSRRGAYFIKKVLASAIANAGELIGSKKLDVDVENLFVKVARVDEGSTMKRWLPRARGHATPIQKKSSHIHIILEEFPEEDRNDSPQKKQKERKSDSKGKIKSKSKQVEKASASKVEEKSKKTEKNENVKTEPKDKSESKSKKTEKAPEGKKTEKAPEGKKKTSKTKKTKSEKSKDKDSSSKEKKE